jgi:hypothetical protein
VKFSVLKPHFNFGVVTFDKFVVKFMESFAGNGQLTTLVIKGGCGEDYAEKLIGQFPDFRIS